MGNRNGKHLTMAIRYRVPSTLPGRLKELGVSTEAVLRRAGLPIGLFQVKKVLLSVEELVAFFQSIAATSGDPAIGFKLGAEQRVEWYDPVAIAGLHARSLRDALERIARFKRLSFPEQITITDHGDDSIVAFDWTAGAHSAPQVAIDYMFAWAVTIGARGTGTQMRPKEVEIRCAPKNRGMYEQYFGCAVKFRSSKDALTFGKQDIDRPFVTYNSDLVATIAPQLERELNEQADTGQLTGMAKTTLKRLIAGQRITIDGLATELNLSTRTLQRRLTAEGLTFQQLLDQARHELAIHYLVHSNLDVSEVAFLLGFEEPNSFRRAFTRWEGISPGRWRDAHKNSEI